MWIFGGFKNKVLLGFICLLIFWFRFYSALCEEILSTTLKYQPFNKFSRYYIEKTYMKGNMHNWTSNFNCHDHQVQVENDTLPSLFKFQHWNYYCFSSHLFGDSSCQLLSQQSNWSHLGPLFLNRVLQNNLPVTKGLIKFVNKDYEVDFK